MGSSPTSNLRRQDRLPSRARPPAESFGRRAGRPVGGRPVRLNPARCVRSRAVGVGPPSGTVTFLFTDVESSTRRWEAEPEAMRAALVVHDEALRSAIEAH